MSLIYYNYDDSNYEITFLCCIIDIIQSMLKETVKPEDFNLIIFLKN